ncbi:MAG: APC family permease [Candidatus Nanopelagicales bacterium]
MGLTDAVMIGLGSMLGAGVFAAFAPAARAAGGALLVGLAVAAVVAYANATSTARLAAVLPTSGGAYAYGRRQLGHGWGFLAGWSFLVGKTASCAAMALTFGSYVAPGYARPLAVAAVLGVVAVNLVGVAKTARATMVIVVIVLAVLALVVAGGVAAPSATDADAGRAGVYGVLQSAGILFFAFAGYARIATLGEEVRDPRRTIPRAVPIALGIALAVYLSVALASLHALGPWGLATSAAPLADVVAAGPLADLAWLVQVGAAVATLGVLLALVAGIGRTAFAMAREGDLPAGLGRVSRGSKVPHVAEVAVGLVVIVVVLAADVRGAIGFSSFTVLTYYAVANASAWRLPDSGRWPRALAALGLVGCAVLGATLPLASVLAGLGVVAVGVLAWAIRRRY